MKTHIIALALALMTAAIAGANDTYRVLRGDNLSGIGKKYGIGYRDIMAANNMQNTTIYEGQVLRIPTDGSAGTTYSAPSHTYPTGSSDRYGAPTPPSGYTPAPSGPYYGPTVTQPASAQVYSVPNPASAQCACPTTGRGGTYIVQRGDSVRSISKKFRVAFWDLRSENDIMFSRLYPGQVLRIPTRAASIGVAF